MTGETLEPFFPFPIPSSSADDCRLDLEPLMPESFTRTNCELGASRVDGGWGGRSCTTLGIKFLGASVGIALTEPV